MLLSNGKWVECGIKSGYLILPKIGAFQSSRSRVWLWLVQSMWSSLQPYGTTKWIYQETIVIPTMDTLGYAISIDNIRKQ